MSAKEPPTGGKRVRLADVAALAGVDQSVVSRLITNDPRLHIRDATRERVLAAIRELGYRPNAAARSLRTARAGAYGLLIPDFANPVYAIVIKGAEAEAATRGSVLLTASSSSNVTSIGQHVDLLTSGRVDGVLFAGAQVDKESLKSLEAGNFPWLYVNRAGTGVRRSIVLDDRGAAQIAVQHLLSLGHRRIGHVAGPPRADTAKRRRAGFTAALKTAGIPADELLISEGDYTPQGGADAMERLLKQRTLPTGVVVSNVASAIGVLNVIAGAGLKVPDDISVVAIHDLPLAERLIPPLTTVSMPLEELGRRALELLATTAPQDPIREVVAGPMVLVERSSTSAYRRARKRA